MLGVFVMAAEVVKSASASMVPNTNTPQQRTREAMGP